MAIDGNSIVNRAFYGIRQLNAPDGTPTNAVYGFLAILQHLLDDYGPDAVCVAFDRKEPTFRHKSCDFYKAQRKPMPEELAVQMPLLKETLDLLGIQRVELAGYEADDLLGTISRICDKDEISCLIVTGDKDSLQLITENTSVCNVKTRMGQTETIFYTPQSFEEEYGFSPPLMVDLKALMGDSSDNIPGVPGVGEKTAKDLVARYGTIDTIYRRLSELDIKDSVRKKLADGKDSAFLSYWLATIFCEVPLELRPEDCRWSLSSSPDLYQHMKRLGFRRFIEKWKLDDSLTTEAVSENGEHLPRCEIATTEEWDELFGLLNNRTNVWSVYPLQELNQIEICNGEKVFALSRLTAGERYDACMRILFSAERKKIGHNVKDLMNLFREQGYSTDGFIFDTALAGYLLWATENDYSLPKLSQRVLNRELDGSEAIALLAKPLQDRLKYNEMDKLMNEIEMPLCSVLSEMEQTGFLVDRKALYEYGESMTGMIDQLQNSIWQMAGHEFNINSPKQLGQVLFEELMLPSGKKTKTGWSTNAEVLEKLRGKHPIIEAILDYRTLTKLKSTYADGLLKVIGSDNRIHTSFQMTVTATGRLSSTEPNLQNIPVRKELGAQIRTMFAAEKGNVLVDADYSQIELRLLAHISGDTAMQEAFLSGEDFHTVTASKVFNVPIQEVTHTLRSRAKAVNFGIVYGISAFSLAQDIHVRPAEAKAYIDAYLERFHGVRDYMHHVVELAREKGYVETLWHRRRDLPELKSSNFNMRSFGERVALNMPIQGTAADIMKLAMVNVDRALKKEALAARLVLQVHDELIVECPEEEAERVQKILKEEMENVVRLSIPLIVDAKTGRTWAEAH